MKNVFLIISVARQVQGEMVVIKPEKAFIDKVKAEDYYNKLIKKYTENIETASGSVQCVCERAIFEMEIEDA